MALITKPDFTYVWASGGAIVAPNDTKKQLGWVAEAPPFQWDNWLQNRQDTSIAYTFQMGVPEWDSLVEYQYHANYKSYVQRNGLVYKALQVGTNKDPATEAAYWALAFDNYGSAATVQSNLTTHITNYGTLASLSNAATARTNLDVYSTTQVNDALALKALLAGSSSQLFSAANGTAGYEVVNKSQLDTGLATKAPVAGNSGQEFAVAGATTGNSAVNKTQLDARTSVATTTQAGIVEICTDAELLAGASDTVVATPLKLRLGFAVSIGTRGYIALPTWLGGVVVQWGKETIATTATVINFPLATMANCYAVVGTADQAYAGGDIEYVGFTSVSATNFTANTCTFPQIGGTVVATGGTFWWLAIGK